MDAFPTPAAEPPADEPSADAAASQTTGSRHPRPGDAARQPLGGLPQPVVPPPTGHLGRWRWWVWGLAVLGVGALGSALARNVLDEKPDVGVGDCVPNRVALGGLDDDLETGPCSERHFGEVFAIVRDGAGEAEPYPGDAPLMRRAMQGCIDEFPDYTGTTVSRSGFQVMILRPLKAGWEEGDRTTICLLAAVEGDLVGSRRGTSTDEALPPERSILSLVVGDCFSSEQASAGEWFAAVELIDCAAPHSFEVIATSDATDDVDFNEVQAFAEQSCTKQFEAYVGVPIDTSVRQLLWITPLASNSDDFGDRRSFCVVADPRADLVGSVRNTNR